MTQRHIVRFWLPLFGSWLLLTLEGPLITTVVSRLPEPLVMLAAQGIVLSLSIFIESPVINLLSTSTAKVIDRPTYDLVRRFTIHWMIGLTLIHILVGFTPLFDLIVRRGMGVGDPIAGWVQIGMQINVLWSAAIGWRRFLQGVLIKFDHTRTIAVGTAVRLLSGALTAIGLGILTDTPGVVIGALTLAVGVMAEALYATWAIRPVLRNELKPAAEGTTALTYAALFWFHLPLAGTSLLALLLQPLAIFSLARLDQPLNSLAAWPVLFQILLIARAPALAMPEVIIALNQSKAHGVALRRFIVMLAIATLTGTLLFTLTPWMALWLDVLQEVPPAVGQLVRTGMYYSLVFPVLTLFVFALRGFLISAQTTRPINVGMAINLSVSAAILMSGVALNWPGIMTATAAINIAVLVEALFLVAQMRHRRARDRRAAVSGYS